MEKYEVWPVTANIKFCGGCNPRYDRAEFARKIEDAYPHIDFQMNGSEIADVVIVLCGCSAACAEVTDSYGAAGRIVLWSPDAWDTLCSFLDRRNIT